MISRITYLLCLSVIIFLVSCASSQQLLQPGLSTNKHYQQQPEFIDNVSITSNANTIKTNGGSLTSNKSGDVKNISFCNLLQLKYASMLGVLPQSITNLSLYNFIDNWYGVQYRMGGNDQNGIDCSAFAKRLYDNVFCTELFRTAREQFSMCSMVYNPDSLQEGDLVFFHTRGRKRISHVGIYLLNNFFVHASSSQGVMISSLEDGYWSRFYAGAGKLSKDLP